MRSEEEFKTTGRRDNETNGWGALPTPGIPASSGFALRKAAAEEQFLRNLIEFTRGVKRSPVQEIAAVARDWEGKLIFRILVEKQAQARKRSVRQVSGVGNGVAGMAKLKTEN